MKTVAKLLVLLALGLGLAPGAASAGERGRPGWFSRAIGKALVHSERRSLRSSDRLIARSGEMMKSRNSLVRDAGDLLGLFGAARGLFGLVKGSIGRDLLGRHRRARD